jgi:apolipoprotein N-acyltransferase
LLTLAKSAISDSTDILVAPETALPSLWEDSVQLPLRNKSLIAIAELLQKYPKVRFIGGAITQRKLDNGEVLSETARQSPDGSYSYDIFNSALMIDQASDLQISHKCILVNGVERMPFQKYFSFIGKYVLDLGGSSGSLGASNEPVLFSGNEGVILGPVICFESVFGEYTGKMVKRGANLLVVLTNDGWWKDSPGTWQHFGYSRIRAVETRRSIAHCANTGISGFINQRGDVLKMTAVNTCAALSSPVQLNGEITFFVSHGDYLGKISTLLSVMVLISLMAYRLRR